MRFLTRILGEGIGLQVDSGTGLKAKINPAQFQTALINLAITNLSDISHTTTLTATGPNVRTTLASSPLNGNVDGLRTGFGEIFNLLDVAMDAAVFHIDLPLVAHVEREGVWILWHENGMEAARGVFRGGLREGRWEYTNRDGGLDGVLSGEYHQDVKLDGAR